MLERAFVVLFDDLPGPQSCTFIECETLDGKSCDVGPWQRSKEGFGKLGPFIRADSQMAIAQQVCLELQYWIDGGFNAGGNSTRPIVHFSWYPGLGQGGSGSVAIFIDEMIVWGDDDGGDFALTVEACKRRFREEVSALANVANNPDVDEDDLPKAQMVGRGTRPVRESIGGIEVLSVESGSLSIPMPSEPVFRPMTNEERALEINDGMGDGLYAAIVRHLEEVQIAEREACAKLAEEFDGKDEDDWMILEPLSKAIRAR